MDSLETLVKMRELLASPKAWTTQAFAKDRLGRSTDELGSDAVCWCLLGAAAKVTGVPGAILQHEVVSLWGDDFGYIVDFNDNPETTHGAVLAKLDHAIEAERRRQREGAAS